ncbi:hypothetical protein [Maricaulis sp.]|uniref:hypothetical protein n=1 Tax=Maricaulis sp. TaxID=1486257 RepID=UPI003A8D29B6
MMRHQQRELRLIEFSGTIMHEEFEPFSRFYLDRDFYRFADREVVLFTPDVSLAAVDVEDISMLADSYIEALRLRGDQTAVLSAWVMGDHVRAETRLWWEFTRDHSRLREPRHIVETVEAALHALGCPQEWAADMRTHSGFKVFEAGDRAVP